MLDLMQSKKSDEFLTVNLNKHAVLIVLVETGQGSAQKCVTRGKCRDEEFYDRVKD